MMHQMVDERFAVCQETRALNIGLPLKLSFRDWVQALSGNFFGAD